MRVYVSWFRGELGVIERLRWRPEDPELDPHWKLRLGLHQKTLCCVMLDALAGHRYPKDRGNASRFKRLLREHTDWATRHLVSVPILAERLTGSSSELARYCRGVLGRHHTPLHGSVPLTAFDVAEATLEPVASQEERRLIGESRHLELLYRYRCFLVHEFREPGYAFEAWDRPETEPVYWSYHWEPQWRLLYPVAFFFGLVRTSLDSLEQYYVRAGIDPYSSVEDSSAWRGRR